MILRILLDNSNLKNDSKNLIGQLKFKKKMIERILQFNSILYYYITCLWIKDSLTKQYEIVLSTMRGKIIFKSINSVFYFNRSYKYRLV